MAKLRHKSQAPPGGWKYHQVDTGLVIEETSLELLTLKVIEHRTEKHLSPVEGWQVQAEIERQICTRLSKTDCFKEGSKDPWVPIEDMGGAVLDASAIMGFSKMMFDWVSSGKPVVDMDELNRRAAICKGCALNQRMQGCGTCSILYRAVNSVIANDRKFEDLHVCGACACSINAKLQLPLESLKIAHQGRDLNFPVYCWNNPDNEVQEKSNL